MTYDRMEYAFGNRIPRPLGCAGSSAVLIPVIELDHKPHLILTQRAYTLKSQPGDFCFPGGRCEEGELAEETALRETWEEIGIPKEKIKIAGPADFLATAYGAYIRPFVGFIHDFALEDLRPNKSEVEKIIEIPLDFFMKTEPDVFTVDLIPDFPEDFPFDKIVGGKSYRWGKSVNKQLFFEYEGNVIWGITARIIHNVKHILLETYKERTSV